METQGTGEDLSSIVIVFVLIVIIAPVVAIIIIKIVIHAEVKDLTLRCTQIPFGILGQCSAQSLKQVKQIGIWCKF